MCSFMQIKLQFYRDNEQISTIFVYETHYLINLTVAVVTDICHHLP